MPFPCHNLSNSKLFVGNYNPYSVLFHAASLNSSTMHFYGKNNKKSNNLLANNDTTDFFHTFNIHSLLLYVTYPVVLNSSVKNTENY